MENEKEPNKTEILTDVDMSEHEKDYSEQGFWDKVQNYAAKAGSTLIYKALQLYYVAQSQECPTKVRAAIYSALGYFILPFDIILDITPVVGYSDDLAAIAMALALAQAYITPDIEQQAKDRIVSIFGERVLEKLEA